MGVQLLQRVADLSKSLCWDAKGLQKPKGKVDHTMEETSFKGTKFLGNTLSLGAEGVSWGLYPPYPPTPSGVALGCFVVQP